MEDNFDFGVLGEPEGSSESDAEVSLPQETESTPERNVEGGSGNDSYSQPQNSPAIENEEYSPRERALLDRIEQLTNQAYQKPQAQSNDDAFTPQEHNFLDGLDIDDVLSSGENLNKLLLAVYNRGLQESLRMANTQFTAQAPNLVREHVTQHMTMRELVDNFYSTNPDLIHARKTVGAIANEVSQENSELSIDEVFAEAAKRTREVLGLPNLVANDIKTEKPNLPTRRQPGNRRNGTATLTGVAKEIDDLLG